MKKMNIDEVLKRKLSGKLTLEPKKKTVHTTFKLSQKGHDAIRTLTGSEGKNADVIELVVKAVAVLGEAKVLNVLPKSLDGELSRKTYVVKRDTLSKLTELAKNGNLSRDVIVDKICISLAGMHKEKILNQIKIYDELKGKLQIIIKQFDNLEKEMADQLGEDDPSCPALSMLSDITSNLSGAIKNYIETGKPIDPVNFIYGIS